MTMLDEFWISNGFHPCHVGIRKALSSCEVMEQLLELIAEALIW